MGDYHPPIVRRRNDYRSDGNIGHTVHTSVDDGGALQCRFAHCLINHASQTSRLLKIF